MKHARPRAGRGGRPVLPALEWLEDVTGRCARATAIGSRSLLVENHTGILAFSPRQVRLGSGRGDICVTGENLWLCDVRPGALIVRGEIHRVDLPCEGGDTPDAR